MGDVELATAIWVHWFNTERLHGSIGRTTPVEFENNWYQTQTAPPGRPPDAAGAAPRDPDTPLRDDTRDDPSTAPATDRLGAPGLRCPSCSALFTPSGRQAYCPPACRQKAYRGRSTASDLQAVMPTGPPDGRREVTVYQCPDCDQPYLGQQWCPDCQRPCLRLGYGGNCHNAASLSQLTSSSPRPHDDLTGEPPGEPTVYEARGGSREATKTPTRAS